MAGDFNKPVVTDAYASVLQSIKDLIADLAKGLDGTGTANVPTNAIRWGSANNRFERYNGSAWVALVATMSQDVTSLSGKTLGALAGNIPVNNGTLNATLNSDLLDGFHASNLQFSQSGRDFVNGTFIQTDIDYSQVNGDPWFMEITGNSYGSVIPFDIKVQGYIYSSTIINYGGVSNGTNISGLVACNYGGKLCFWFPRQEYWQGFNVYVNSSYAGPQNNRVTSISDIAKPSVTKEVALSASIRQSYHTGNFTPNSVSQNNIGAAGNYGALTFLNNVGGWAGFKFGSGSGIATGSENRYFMTAAGQTGEYDTGIGWQWRWDNGTLAVGTVPWARLSGVPAMNYLGLGGGTLTGSLTLQGEVAITTVSPTIRLHDTDGRGAYIHNNSSHLCFLRMNDAKTSWEQLNGWWPAYCNLDGGQEWYFSGNIQTRTYGWLHDYFFNNVANCGGQGTGSPAINCYGSGNTIAGYRHELIDNGGQIQIRTVNYLSNCNCNCVG